MERPLRQDAARNRQAILDAARAVFSAEGLETPLEVIADRAGVGRGTLYRNFPDRTSLAVAVLLDEMQRLADWTRAQGDEPEVFFAFLERLAEIQSLNAGLRAALYGDRAAEVLAPLRAKLIEAGGPPLARAQAAGLVRADLTVEDLRVLAVVLGAIFPGVDEGERKRLDRRRLSILLDGLKVRA